MNLWSLLRRPEALPPDQSLRMCCLQLANGDVEKAAAFHLWITRGAVPLIDGGKAARGRVIQFGDKPGPSGDAA